MKTEKWVPMKKEIETHRTENFPRLATVEDCNNLARKVKSEWVATGSYGCVKWDVEDFIREIMERALTLPFQTT